MFSTDITLFIVNGMHENKKEKHLKWFFFSFDWKINSK